MRSPKDQPGRVPMIPAVAGEDARAALDRALRVRGIGYAELSALIGRNAAYIQQFIHRGSPRALNERDRATIADFLAIDEQLIGGPARDGPPGGADLAMVPRLDVDAAAGAGGLAGDDRMIGPIGFDPRYLRSLSANPRLLSIIRVQGDSMVPTLAEGEDIMVDAGDGAARLRTGIYVLRRDGALLVKRLVPAAKGAAGLVSIISDNDALYPAEHGVPMGALDIVGRVIWASRLID